MTMWEIDVNDLAIFFVSLLNKQTKLFFQTFYNNVKQEKFLSFRKHNEGLILLSTSYWINNGEWAPVRLVSMCAVPILFLLFSRQHKQKVVLYTYIIYYI